MTLGLALVAAIGTALAVAPSGRPSGTARHRLGPAARRQASRWLAQAGLPDADPRRVAAAGSVAGVLAGFAAHLVFGGWLVPMAAAAGVLAAPIGALRRRRQVARAAAEDHWPALLEEIRVLTAAAGRSVPRALLEAGRRAPAALRPAFDAAEREWMLTTDFERTVAVLKDCLDSATADVVAETLVVANELGAPDLDARLGALAEDRRQDLFARRDAEAKQAGVRFARRFVLIVPAGMAIAGMSLGTGRAAYATPLGQAAVAAALALVGLCWLWSGRMLRLPRTTRVFP